MNQNLRTKLFPSSIFFEWVLQEREKVSPNPMMLSGFEVGTSLVTQVLMIGSGWARVR